MSTLRIWLGDLAAYNEGRLVGEWLALPMPEDDLAAKITQYSRDGQGDYYIADWESDVPGLVKESSSPQHLNEIAETLEGLTDYDRARVGYLLGQGYSADDALSSYEDVNFYEGMRLRDVAMHLHLVDCEVSDER